MALLPHLARRREIAAAAGIVWKSQPTIGDEHEIEDRSYAEMRRTFGQFTPLSLFRQYFRLLFEKKDREWLGELEGRVSNAR